MTTAIRRAAATLVMAAAPLSVHADVYLRPDPTGLWFDPNQPGWGLEVAQQGETAFAVLFTYDANHKPVWYVASNLSNGVDFNELPAYMQGTLYRATGPAFSASSFDPHAVGVTAVGKLAITYTLGAPPGTLTLAYSIDGTQYSRLLSPQTWSSSAQGLVGDFGGQVFLGLINGGDTPPNCPTGAAVTTLPVQPSPYTFSVAVNGAPDRVKVTWGSGVDIGCAIDARYAREGQLGSLDGNLACGPIGGPLPAGDHFAVVNIASTASGFSGIASLEHSLPGGGLCRYSGTFGGVLRQPLPSLADSDRTGVWYNAAESGWGLILTEQGDNIFGALFAYGADNQPTWWVASNIVSGGDFPGLGSLFGGTLYRTTGPYLGAADATPMSATPVGTLRFLGPSGSGVLSLMYTVDGTTVTKTLTRQSWSTNRAFLTGSFTGGLFPSQGSTCNSDLFATTPVTLVTRVNEFDPLTLSWTGVSGASCTMSATYTGAGQLANLSGLVQCNGAPAGSLTIRDASVTETGFHGFASFAFGDCAAAGSVGGVRR